MLEIFFTQTPNKFIDSGFFKKIADNVPLDTVEINSGNISICLNLYLVCYERAAAASYGAFVFPEVFSRFWPTVN